MIWWKRDNRKYGKLRNKEWSKGRKERKLGHHRYVLCQVALVQRKQDKKYDNKSRKL